MLLTQRFFSALPIFIVIIPFLAGVSVYFFCKEREHLRQVLVIFGTLLPLTLALSVIPFVQKGVIITKNLDMLPPLGLTLRIDKLGFYIVAERTTERWEGVAIEVSRDGGENYDEQFILNEEGIIGELLEPIKDHPHEYPDTHNQIKLKTMDYRDVLMSYDLREMLNRKGLMLIGDELLNYGTAEDDAEGNWTLSHLFRGRKGTPTSSHIDGERVVLFDYGSVPFIESSLYDVGKTFTLRITSLGTDVSYTMSYTFNGNSQRERKPNRLQVKREGDMMQLSWLGTGRLGGGTNVAMGAYFSGYQVTINGKQHDVVGNQMSLTVPYEKGSVSVAQVNSIMGVGESISVRVD